MTSVKHPISLGISAVQHTYVGVTVELLSADDHREFADVSDYSCGGLGGAGPSTLVARNSVRGEFGNL